MVASVPLGLIAGRPREPGPWAGAFALEFHGTSAWRRGGVADRKPAEVARRTRPPLDPHFEGSASLFALRNRAHSFPSQSIEIQGAGCIRYIKRTRRLRFERAFGQRSRKPYFDAISGVCRRVRLDFWFFSRIHEGVSGWILHLG